MSDEEFKPRKRWIDYKAEKLFGNMELKIVAPIEVFLLFTLL